METNTEIGTKVQEAIRSLQSKGKIVRRENEYGKPEFYLKTEGVSLKTEGASIDGGEKFDLEIPLALTEEGRDLGVYLALHRQIGTYTPDRSLRM